MHRRRIIVTVLAGGLLAAASAAQQQPSQTGHALDSNPQVGSGGINPEGAPGRFDSQLYITGQVRGLSDFRGRVPYRASDQLGLTLPSSGLNDFERRSVGLSDVTGGGLYGAQPYFSPSQTVVGLRGISAGLTAPGSNVPRAGSASALVRARLYEEVIQPYRPLVPLSSLPQAPLDAPELLVAPSRAQLAPPPVSAWDTQEPIEGNRSLSRWRVPDVEGGDDLSSDLQRLLPMDLRVDTFVDRRTEPRPAGQRPEEKEPPATPYPEPAAEPGRIPGATPEEGLQPNQDVLTDLLLRLRESQARRQGEGRPAEGPFGVDDSAKSLTAPQTPVAAAEPTTPASYVEITPDNRVVIRRLAGEQDTAFNRYMQRGRALLRQGAYYDAVRQYDYAMVMEPGNPLALMGRGLGYFAAGEDLTAAGDFRRAMQILPPLMETRLDVYDMMDGAAFGRMLGRLDERIEKEGRAADPLLLFLATYLHGGRGDVREAMRYAKLLESASPPGDLLLRSYATYVLTGRRPAEGSPATQPAADGP